MVVPSRRMSKRWRRRSGLLRQLAAAFDAKRKVTFITLRNGAGRIIDSFLDFRSVMALRGCSSELRRVYCPDASPLLWQRIRPSFIELRHLARKQTLASVMFLLQIYTGASAYACTTIIHDSAVEAGTLELVKWCIADASPRLNAKIALEGSVKHGRIEVAKWLMEHHHLSLDALSTEALRQACDSGDVRVAQWLHNEGYVRKEGEDGISLLRSACVENHLAVAEWIVGVHGLNRNDIESEDLLIVASDSGAPEMIRWIIEKFELAWADLSDDYTEIVGALRRRLAAGVRDVSSATLKWFMDRYCSSYMAKITHSKTNFLHEHLIAENGSVSCQLRLSRPFPTSPTHSDFEWY